MNPLYALSLLGSLVCAVSGALAAGRKRLDWLGVAVLSTVTAIGGGTLRDVLLNRHPVFWIADPNYLLVSLLASGLMVLYVRRHSPPNTSLLIADALGLAFFSLSGAQITEQRQNHAVIVVVMGAITGTAGGVLRDLLCGETPLLLQKGELYATAAIAGVSLYLVLEKIGVAQTPASLLGMTMVLCLRYASIHWQITLPVFQVEEAQGKIEASPRSSD